ncbi:MAG: hypothetical protein K2O08_04315 [Clostridia bacterium]|nr:hypothetical protein [Clostridia bacterium]
MKMKLFSMQMLAAAGDTGALENNLTDFGSQLNALIGVIWPWLIGVGLALVALWGAFIGIKVIKAKKAEEKQEAKAYIKQLILGIAVVFIIAAGLPLIISGMATWAGTSIVKFN